MADKPVITYPAFTREDVEEFAEWIAETILAGGDVVTSTARAAALRYARTRAAQLLGMKLDRATGEYVQATRAAYRVGDDIREKVQDIVAEVVREGTSVGTLNERLLPLFEQIEGRATMIARTEPALALNAGMLSSLEEQGVELVEVVDGPGCMPDDHDDAAPLPDPSIIGEVQYDRQANGQVWTVAQAAELLTSHPNCGRSFLPRD